MLIRQRGVYCLPLKIYAGWNESRMRNLRISEEYVKYDNNQGFLTSPSSICKYNPLCL